jgi:hypothetical protein
VHARSSSGWVVIPPANSLSTSRTTTAVEAADGTLAALAAESDGLEALGGRLAGLAPGFGRAAVVRFLEPLRDHWIAAADLPLAPAARSAAVHLGWIEEWEDTDGAPGALRRALEAETGAPPLADVEAALTRLGQRACLRERTARCPLRDACPRR